MIGSQRLPLRSNEFGINLIGVCVTALRGERFR
jgi:hypothetical protein